MSKQQASHRLTVPALRARKGGEKLVCLTAYTAPMAALLDPHCDLLLVGDSVGMVLHGLPSTVGVTLDMMILHGRAVMRGSAQAVKVEAGAGVAESIAFLTGRGIPVIGHVGLRPQAVNVEGGFKAHGRSEVERAHVMAEARAADEAGAFAIVVEGVAAELAQAITATVSAPTIGIGAGARCDGQILVTDDMLGLFEWTPKFVRRYGDLRAAIEASAARYAADVRSGVSPGEAETYRFSSS